MLKKLPFPLLVVVSFLIGGLAGFFVIPSDMNLLSPVDSGNGGGKQAEITPAAGKQLVEIPSGEAKDQMCPLNGLNYTLTEKNLWETRRPMAVMIENHFEARPQSGLSTADVVYEAVAEGGITRFMALYYCESSTRDLIVGPVRSARTYFLDMASEYSKFPIYVHVGGANLPGKSDALGQIKDYGWYGANDLNQFGLSVKECWRDYNRLGNTTATEHTMYCSTDALLKVAAKRGFTAVDKKNEPWTKTFKAWTFKESAQVSADGKDATTLTFDFWKDFTQFTVKWAFDATSNLYKRDTGGTVHVDRNTNQQLAFDTIVVQYVTETGPINENKHMLYGMIGSGNALIFNRGKVDQVTWAKKNRLDRTVYKDSKGKEYNFNPGKIWIEVVPKTAEVVYN